MNIKKYIGTNKKEVESKTFNIYIGISIRNKYFTKENIKKYLDWALDNTKDKVAILVADEIQRYNDKVFFNLSEKSSKKTAIKQGKKIKILCDEIIKEYPSNIQNKIYLITWKDVTNSFYYKENTNIILNEFKSNSKFRNNILNYMKTNMNVVNNLDKEKLEYITNYLIEELTVFLNGFLYKGVHFNLFPYPGIGIFDLTYKLKSKKIFPDIANKLYLDTKTAYIEGFV